MQALPSRVDTRSETYRTNREGFLEQISYLNEQLALARAGGGEKYVERHRQRGKLMARERIELLLDRDSPFLEIAPLCAWGTEFGLGGSAVSGIGVVSGVECAITANDPTVPAPPTGTVPGAPTRESPLGAICGARSGDKGGNANVGVWVRSADAYRWLDDFLSVECLRELLPETRELGVDRFAFPNLLGINFVVKGLLGDGVAASLRSDPQAKSLGEYLRAKLVPIPISLLEGG